MKPPTIIIPSPEQTLCFRAITVIEHPDHKLREAPYCGRCEAIRRALEEGELGYVFATAFTKGGKRRHEAIIGGGTA